MSLEEAAKIIADTVSVLERDYLDKKRPVDATPVLDKFNKSLKADLEAKEALALKSALEESQKSNTLKEQQISTLIEELRDANKRFSRLDAEKVAMSVEVESLRQQIVLLRQGPVAANQSTA